MKLVSYFILFVIILSSVYAQDRKESVAIKEDQGALFITNYDINVNCCSKFESELKIEDKKITITERDTGEKCYCGNCYFDLEFKIMELQVGDYSYEIWRNELTKYGYPKDSLYLVFSGNLKVTIGLPMPPFFMELKQSECHKETAVRDESPTSDNLNISPNPAENSAKISYELEKTSDITIFIYDILGRELKRINLQSVNPGKQEYILETSEFQSGIYYCNILDSNKIYKSCMLNVIR